jgi:hypothetical protein
MQTKVFSEKFNFNWLMCIFQQLVAILYINPDDKDSETLVSSKILTHLIAKGHFNASILLDIFKLYVELI